MQHKSKIIEYYKSGRYECDYDTHLQLRQVVKELNLYEWLPVLQRQIHLLAKIKELTQINANCLDEDYDDEEGLCQTYKIRSMINSLNSQEIPKIIEQCQVLQWEPYQTKVLRILTGKEQYLSIVQRIKSTIHSDQFRRDSMLSVAFFQHINGSQLQQLINTYQVAIEHYLNYLTKQRNKFHLLIEAAQYSNIMRTGKVRKYVGTAYFIVRCCLRFCDILKVLTGKNNLSLKFTVVKKEIERLMKHYKEWKFQDEKEQIFRSLTPFKQSLKTGHPINKSKVCRWCLKLLKYQEGQHSFCFSLIHQRELFQ